MNDIVRRFARLQVPRYTSYPMAAEFTVGIGAADQRRWLNRIDTSDGVSVYLHMPYFRKLCLYCRSNIVIEDLGRTGTAPFGDTPPVHAAPGCP